MAGRNVLIRTSSAIAVTLAIALGTTSPAPRAAGTPSPAQAALRDWRRELVAAEALQGLKAKASAAVIIRDVRLVDPEHAAVTPGQTVIVFGERIAWVGDAAKAPGVPDATVIQGRGRFLSPGLVDMHIHTETADAWLLNLANGVTTVRDMDGFPWMLKARDNIAAGRMLGPMDYVAGPIINGEPLEGYAVVPHDALAVRRLVRQAAACGYDFVKIHNILPEAMFDAAADEARRQGMDLVGHVPHDLPVRRAIQGGMRTMEHLKGFLNDGTLKLGDTDYGAIDGAEVWITPTLYATRRYRLDESRAFLDGPQARFHDAQTLSRWRASLTAPPGRVDTAGREAQPIIRAIMQKLIEHKARFLAGTDAAGYPYSVMGFALVDEVNLLVDAGLTPAQALQAATSEPAKALRLTATFGAIRKGMRADFVLLDTDPLASPKALVANAGVMAHGIWLARPDLDSALDRVAASYAEPASTTKLDRAGVEAIYRRTRALTDAGFVFNAATMKSLASALRAEGFADVADRFAALAYDPQEGPCATDRPS